ncbi:MAG: GIY-YIG nuclease family protein [Methylobacter sp.]|nr:GIY-YIG nuclease family protein [Methylobacter sp.]
MILCTDDTLYTGITVNVARRFSQHANKQGAKYFRGRQPKQLVYVETGHDRSTASKREIVIKKLPRFDKFQLLASENNKVGDFPL